MWLRPIWLLGHVVALVAVLSFVRLGVWQLDRLHEKQARNRIIAARADGPPVDIEDVELDRAEYQHVSATGRFDVDDEVTIRNRTFAGVVGRHVVTPLVLDDGTAVLVNRGWIPLDGPPPAPPDGAVTVDGLLLQTQERSIGPKDPDDGVLDELNRVDVQRVQQQVDVDLYPLYVQLEAPAPAGDYPEVLDPPPRDEGPHRSYAIQWFLFAAVVLVGYPILLRRRIAQASGDVAGEGAE
jgi:surfeit locus 1 family protein